MGRHFVVLSSPSSLFVCAKAYELIIVENFIVSMVIPLVNVCFSVMPLGVANLAFASVPGSSHLHFFGRGDCGVFSPVPSSLELGCGIVNKATQVLMFRENQLIATTMSP